MLLGVVGLCCMLTGSVGFENTGAELGFENTGAEMGIELWASYLNWKHVD
jgi:hypothetical protein